MDFKQGLSKQITKINMKTSTFLEETKIRTYITTLETEMKDLKTKAGELGYTMWKEDACDDGQLIAIYEAIGEKQQQIQEQEQMIQELVLKSKQVLGEETSAGGTLQEGAAADRIFCPACGEGYPVSVNFCKKCGTKLR